MNRLTASRLCRPLGLNLLAASFAFAVASGGAEPATVYDFAVTRIDGSEESLAAYRGKVLLIVNVASRCGFTRQYGGLQEAYEKYRDRGFEVLGFPANNFAGQEPGTNEEIMEFCSTKFSVTFPMFEKISVKGRDMHPLYSFLTSGGGDPARAAEVGWNFNKFLVGKDGRLIAHFGSRTAPDSADLTRAIESALQSP